MAWSRKYIIQAVFQFVEDDSFIVGLERVDQLALFLHDGLIPMYD